MEDDLSHLLHLSDNLLRNERRGQGREGGDQHKDHREVFRGGGRLLNHHMKTGLDCKYKLKLGELHWAQVCILVDVEERDKEDETSINIQRRRGRLVAKRGRRKRRLFFLKIRWEGFKAATTSLMLPWFLKMECLKKLTERLWQPPSPQTS